MRITYLITGLYTGGAETMLKRIVTHLDKNKYDVTICSIISGGEIYKELKEKGYNVISLGFKGLYDFGVLFRLRKFLKEEKPDILHCFMFHSNILGRFAAFGMGIKVVSSVRDVMLTWWAKIFDFLTQWMVDMYTPNSVAGRFFLNKYGIRKSKIRVIKNGLENDAFSSAKIDKQELKKSLGITDNYPIIVSVGNMRKQKDYPTLIKAISLVLKDIKVNFLVIGSGTEFQDETKKLKMIVKDLGVQNNVNFLGYRNDVKNILAISDIWASATLYEGQCNSLLEAMAMRVPAVTTDIPENSEVVENDKEGLLVPVKSPQKLADAIKKLINDREFASRLSKNAYDKAIKDYRIEKIVKETDELYEKLGRE